MTEDTRTGDAAAPRATQGPATRNAVENMRAGRQARRWSGEELAARMTSGGMPWKRSTVADLENSFRKDMTVDELVALAFVFNVPVTSFLEGTSEPLPAGIPDDGTCGHLSLPFNAHGARHVCTLPRPHPGLDHASGPHHWTTWSTQSVRIRPTQEPTIADRLERLEQAVFGGVQ